MTVDMDHSQCGCDDWENGEIPSTCGIIYTSIMTLAICVTFLMTKSVVDEFRKAKSRVTVVVIGAGPIGLLSAIIAAKSGRLSKIIIYEEKSRFDLLANNYQLTLDDRSLRFLTSLGIDFDNIEGCWDKGFFSTRTGVFLEYLISTVDRLDTPTERKLNTKFTNDCLRDLDKLPGRVVVIVCDGATGRAASLLGLSDEFVTHSCRAYAAFAILQRKDQHSVPAPEIRAHKLNFDMNANNSYISSREDSQGFHLKIFGCLKTRCLALVVPKDESRVVKMLRLTLDQSVMRTIFRVCYNTYKTEEERHISEADAARHMKFSPRLFEVKLSHRLETVAFVEDVNIFVVAEGDTTRTLNFHTGVDVNLGIRGLNSLDKFLQMAASAENEETILQALYYKHDQSKILTADYTKNGLQQTMFA